MLGEVVLSPVVSSPMLVYISVEKNCTGQRRPRAERAALQMTAGGSHYRHQLLQL